MQTRCRLWIFWKRVPDSGSGDWVCYIDGVVRSAGNDVQKVVADDWRCLRQECNNLPDTAARCCGDIGGLTPSLYRWTRSATESVQVGTYESVTVHGRTCACSWRDERRRSAPVIVCRWVPCCSSQLKPPKKRGQVSSQVHRLMSTDRRTREIGVARRNMMHIC